MIVDLIQKDESKIKLEAPQRQTSSNKIRMKKIKQQSEEQYDDDQDQGYDDQSQEEEQDEEEEDDEYYSSQSEQKRLRKKQNYVKVQLKRKNKMKQQQQQYSSNNSRKKKKMSGGVKKNIKRQQQSSLSNYEQDSHYPSSSIVQPQLYHPDHFQQYPYYNPYFNPNVMPGASHDHRMMYQSGAFPYQPFSPYPSNFFPQPPFMPSSYRDGGFLSNRHAQQQLQQQQSQQQHSNAISPGGGQIRFRYPEGAGAFSGVQNYDSLKNNNSMGLLYTPRNAGAVDEQSIKSGDKKQHNQKSISNENQSNEKSIKEEKEDNIQSSRSFKKESLNSISMPMPPAESKTYDMSRNYSFAAVQQNELQDRQKPKNSNQQGQNKQQSDNVKKEATNQASQQIQNLDKISGRVLEILSRNQDKKSEQQIKTPQLPSAAQNKPPSFVPPPLNIELIQQTQNQMHKQFQSQQQHSFHLQSSSNYPGVGAGGVLTAGNNSTKSNTDLYHQQQSSYNGNTPYPVPHIQIPPSTIVRHAPSPINPLISGGGAAATHQPYYYRNAGSGGTPTPYGYSGYSPHRNYSNMYQLPHYPMQLVSPALRISPNSSFQPTSFFGEHPHMQQHHHHQLQQHHHHNNPQYHHYNQHPMESSSSYIGRGRQRAGSIDSNKRNQRQ